MSSENSFANLCRKVTLLVCLSLPVLGCGKPQAEFALSERAQKLIPAAQDGLVLETEEGKTEVPGIRGYLEEHFGTPQNLVAWLRMPVNFGRYDGTVAAVDGSASVVDAFAAEFQTDIEHELDGTGLLWLSGQYQGMSVPVAGFDPETKMLSLGVKLEPPPAQGDQFAVVGHLLQTGQGLYERHCMHCHGANGGGNGPTAEYLNPLPRDYRAGVFKFTSTRKGERPSREDMVRTIKHGIPGTYMPSFMLLPEGEIEAIVEYVLFLSMRGEVENMLVAELESDFSKEAVRMRVEGGEERSAIQQQLAQTLQQYFPDSVDRAGDLIADGWNRAEEPESIVLPVKTLDRQPAEGAPQGDVSAEWSFDERGWTVSKSEAGQQEPSPVSGLNLDEVGRFEGEKLLNRLAENEDLASYRIEVAVEVPRTPDTAASRSRGRALFLSGRAQCAACHGATGEGNGPQTEAFQKIPGTNQDYDEPGLFDDWGHPIEPRDLTRGIYRGGRRPIDLYRRVHAGIKGTPMPPFGAALSPEEIWDLVNYVTSIPHQGPGSPSPGEETEIATTTNKARGRPRR